jgi:hypothetical protein
MHGAPLLDRSTPVIHLGPTESENGLHAPLILALLRMLNHLGQEEQRSAVCCILNLDLDVSTSRLELPAMCVCVVDLACCGSASNTSRIVTPGALFWQLFRTLKQLAAARCP